MRDKIEKAIHSSREPVYRLEDVYRNLDKPDRDQFWSIVEDIAFTGNLHERFVALEVIALFIPPFTDDLVDRQIAMIHIDEEHDIAVPIISIIREKRLSKHLDFCCRILQYAKDNDDAMLFSISFRSLLVLSWREVFDDIRAIIGGTNNRKTIDTLAYFKYFHNSQDWEELVSKFNDSERGKVTSLKNEIEDRIRTAYAFLDRI